MRIDNSLSWTWDGQGDSRLAAFDALSRGLGMSDDPRTRQLRLSMQTDPDASAEYARLMLQGKIACPNVDTPITLLEKAIESGSMIARCYLAEELISGLNIERNIDRAKELNSEPLQQELPAAYALEVVLSSEETSPFFDPDKVLQLIQDGCSRGNIVCHRFLAQILTQGAYGLSPDAQQAFHHYEIASQGGDLDSQVAVGSAYLNGTGVDKDLQKGFEIVKDAADKGNNLAVLITYDFILECAQGSEREKFQYAQHYIFKAGLFGHPEAFGLIAYGDIRAYYSETPNYERALLTASEGYKLNDPLATKTLSEIYYNGYGVTKDLAESKRLALEAESLYEKFRQL